MAPSWTTNYPTYTEWAIWRSTQPATNSFNSYKTSGLLTKKQMITIRTTKKLCWLPRRTSFWSN